MSEHICHMLCPLYHCYAHSEQGSFGFDLISTELDATCLHLCGSSVL